MISLPWLVGAVFGPAYAASYRYAYLLFFGTLLFAAARTLSARLRGSGFVALVVVHEIVTLLLLVGLGLPGVVGSEALPLATVWGIPALVLIGLHAFAIGRRS